MSDRLTQTRRVGEEDRRVFSLNQSVSTRKARGRRVCLSEGESFAWTPGLSLYLFV